MAQTIRRGDNDGLVSERARLRMVETLRGQGVTSPAVLQAMSTVPRHVFVEHGLASRAYEDVALPIGHGQTISKPSTVARMIQLMVDGVPENKLKSLKVLEIGTGCGYQAAVLAQIFADVVSVERVRWLHELARTHIRPFRLPNLRLVFGDGSVGVPAGAPYDAMISAAAAERIAEDWLLQLQVGGRLVAPVKSATSDAQSLHVVDRVADDDWSLTVLDSVRFVPLRSGTSR
ncbi:MAG: protein-L-isoaspartate(D-aspartate) O-methyltransferase [Burkholderiaceae bacterium]|nr:protein-L-isoaspartate(D-aspartate) O-methyltransferase [Burkholderiaceae bacterium]